MASCVEPVGKQYSKLPPGIWRGVLLLDNPTPIEATDSEVVMKDNSEGELPFNLTVDYVNESDFTLTIHNGAEDVVVSDIIYGLDRATAKDTLTIQFPTYGSYIDAIFEEDIIEGHFINPRKKQRIPFKAYHGRAHRFTTMKEEPITDISGRWEVRFNEGKESAYPAVGEFKQDGNHLTGTFMTETGDYRFLEGTIQKDKFWLSTFDGGFVFLFTGKILEDNTITGLFRSGQTYFSDWSAKRNDDVTLADPFALTKLTDTDKPMTLELNDLDGNKISLNDEASKDKIKLIKISGTWCPNCKDEMSFLEDYIANNPSDDLRILDVNFEYGSDEANIAKLKKYAAKHTSGIEVLYGGKVSKDRAKEVFPQLEKIMSYPSLLFVDKNNMLRYVHAGFAGPATSGYAAFKKQFSEKIALLRSESK